MSIAGVLHFRHSEHAKVDDSIAQAPDYFYFRRGKRQSCAGIRKKSEYSPTFFACWVQAKSPYIHRQNLSQLVAAGRPLKITPPFNGRFYLPTPGHYAGQLFFSRKAAILAFLHRLISSSGRMSGQ